MQWTWRKVWLEYEGKLCGFWLLDFLTYLMMKISLGKYEILLCNVVDGIGSLKYIMFMICLKFML